MGKTTRRNGGGRERAAEVRGEDGKGERRSERRSRERKGEWIEIKVEYKAREMIAARENGANKASDEMRKKQREKIADGNV